MNDNDLWVKGLKEHYRFSFDNGKSNFNLTLEDLFNLNLDELDKIYGDLDNELSKVEDKKTLFKDKNNPLAIELQNKMCLVESVYNIKKEELDLLNDSMVKNEQKQKLLRLISEKEDEVLKDKSVDELRDMLNNL